MEVLEPSLLLLAGYGRNSHPPPTSTPATTATGFFSRQLGVLERKFDLAGAAGGQSDTFLQLNFTVPPGDGPRVFFSRLPLAWASLRARHPSLASTIHDSVLTRHLDPVPSPREMRYMAPISDHDALEKAYSTLLMDEQEKDNIDQRMETVLRNKVLNGPRAFLDQERCLARLVVFRGSDGGRNGMTLVIAHCISDGLSVFQLIHELFDLISLASLPTPPLLPSFHTLDDFILGVKSDFLPVSISATITQPWRLCLPSESIRFPQSTEALFPDLPLPCPSTPTEPTVSASSRVARERWFFAISRVLIVNGHRRRAATHRLPRIASSSSSKPPNTSWPSIKFSKDTTGNLVRFSKANHVSPNMLLYSMLAISLSNVFVRLHGDSPEIYRPIIFAFPISLRQFFHDTFPSTKGDLAIRITFESIILPSFPQTGEDPEYLRWTAVKGAKIAARQFEEVLHPSPEKRSRLYARAYYRILDRLHTALGINTNPLSEAPASLTASMIGDVDRVLQTTYIVPVPGDQSALKLSNALIGTRLHNGEGSLLEAFTWDGSINICFGFDDTVLEPAIVHEVLSQVQRIGDALSNLEEQGWRPSLQIER